MSKRTPRQRHICLFSSPRPALVVVEGLDIAPVEVASHVQVIKLVAKVAVMSDAGEEVQKKFGGAERDQDADGEARQRLGRVRFAIERVHVSGGRVRGGGVSFPWRQVSAP